MIHAKQLTRDEYDDFYGGPAFCQGCGDEVQHGTQYCHECEERKR